MPSTSRPEKGLFYGVADRPAWLTCLLMGFQQAMVCAAGVISMPILVADMICAGKNNFARVNLLGTTMFSVGIATILQSLCGTRLPLLQGPSFSFFPPILVMMTLPQFQCPADFCVSATNCTAFNLSASNELWMERMTVIQGGLIMASVVQMLLGITGLVGILTMHIGPLTIAPLMLLLEISVVPQTVTYMAQHWISVLTIALLILTAIYLNKVEVPVPKFRYQDKKCAFGKVPIFALFPYIIAIGAAWILCVICTSTDVFDKEHAAAARTDARGNALSEAPWFRFPYPGQWGVPVLDWGVFFGMVGGTIASVIESVGDYQACARVCNEQVPPSHAVNRGIFMEGFACFIGGFLGGGVSVTTYSENIGVIGITKVASRVIMVVAGLLFVIMGIFTKFGAILATIPDPLVGSILVLSLSMVAGVGLSSVRLVDLRLSRNLAILGLAIFFGILIPGALKNTQIRTGWAALDQMLTIILSIEMLVGGMIGFFLDNTVPGATRKQRGLVTAHHLYSRTPDYDPTELDSTTYDFPKWLTKLLANWKWTKYVPILPNFQMPESNNMRLCAKCKS